MNLTLDPDAKEPPFEQLRQQFIEQIINRELRAGAKVPTVRALAAELGLAVNTVARTYRELVAEGYFISRGRQGTFVADVAPASEEVNQQAKIATQEYVEQMRRLGFWGSGDPASNYTSARYSLNMALPPSTSPGWYPDPATGGTVYWDGKKWTGDRRPPRKSFAAASSNGALGGLLIAIGILFSIIWLMAFTEEPNWAYIVAAIVIFTGSIIGGIYLIRGQGPSTAEVLGRLAEEEKEARNKRRWANVASVVSSFTHKRPANPPSGYGLYGDPQAQQIQALSNPHTAQALQNLQNLQYTRVLTQAEFQAAKNILVGQQSFGPIEQLNQLTELHRTGVLGDIEFSAAKARLLGL